MPRFWWDDAQLRARAAGPVNLRVVALVLVAAMTAGATSGACILAVESSGVTAPASSPRAP